MSWCAPIDEMPSARPTIILSLHSPIDEKIVDYIGAGCEEENIPVAWYKAQDLNETPHEVSLRSRLQIGIIAEKNHAYIGVVHLPGKIWLDAEMKNPDDWRWLGQAAARVVKSQPLPPTPEMLKKQRAEASAKAKNTMTSDLKDLKETSDASSVHAQDAGLYKVEAPYLKERESYINNIDLKDLKNLDTLVSLVTGKIIEQLRQKGSEAVG